MYYKKRHKGTIGSNLHIDTCIKLFFSSHPESALLPKLDKQHKRLLTGLEDLIKVKKKKEQGEMKWKTEKSKYLINDKWLKVRADKCIMPNKKIVEPYYVLEYPINKVFEMLQDGLFLQALHVSSLYYTMNYLRENCK